MSPKHEDSVAVHWAKEVLSGAQPIPPFDTLRARVSELKGEDQFSWARRVLRQVDTEGGTDGERRTWIRQQLALCTYKDVNLPTQQRVAWALKALSQEELIATTSAETLGIVGAIYKLRWGFEGRKQDLEQSGFFYERGHAHAKPDRLSGHQRRLCPGPARQ